MVTIRERTPADLEGCVETLKAVHKASGYPVRGVDDGIAFLSNPNIMRAWVAEHEGRIVGHIAVAKAIPTQDDVAIWRARGNTEEVACLERLFVHPQTQGMGTAPKLIAAAIEYAAAQGMRLVLYTLLKDPPARRLYEKLGWKQYGEFQFKYGDANEMLAFCYISPELAQRR